MNWLLWREYRLNRLILITGAVLMLVPYLIIGIEVLFEGANSRGDFRGAFTGSVMFSWLTVSLLAGNAIAGERADRCAEFIAYLPLPRRLMLFGKLFLLLIAVVVFCVANLLGALIFVGPVELFAARFQGVPLLASFFINFFVIFGVGWLFSSFQSSPAFASVAGFVAGILILCCTWVVVGMSMEEPSKYVPTTPIESMMEDAFVWHAMIGFPVAIVCFSIGTWYYLRNSEPQVTT